MSRRLMVLYGFLGYAVGMVGLSLFMAYIGGWGLPRDINAAGTLGWPAALVINLIILLLFGVQHSVMARQGFKDWLAKYLPPAAERSTYVMLSGLACLLICFGWQSMGGVLWHIDSPVLRSLMLALQCGGWGLAVASTFMLSHPEMFGIEQTLAYAKERPSRRPEFNDRWGYAWVRHPIQLGVLIGIWASPTMSVTHLVLSVGMTVYIFIGLALEERDLLAEFGETYRDYQRRVPRLLPMPRWSTAAASATPVE